jgi:hypothetical protein
MTGPLYGRSQGALMSGTGAGSATGRYLGYIRNENTQFVSVFIVCRINLTGTKRTNLTALSISWFSPLGRLCFAWFSSCHWLLTPCLQN